MGKLKFTFILSMLPFLLGAQRIINGTIVNKSDELYWSTVRIIEKNSAGYWIPNCTGVVLTSNLVLTAAHCVEKLNAVDLRIAYELQPFSFEQQSYESTRIDPTINFETREIVGWITHPDYEKDKVGNDITIILINGKHPEKFHSLPIISSEMVKKVVPDKKYYFTIAGYGLFAANPTVESEDLRKAKVTGKFANQIIEMNQSEGYGGCFGDSGGPAMINLGAYSYLAGITQGSKDINPDCEDTGVWVNLATHLGFIHSVTKSLK